ncbi:MAG: hypothetical protein M1440_01380 [Gammaproteobacteria bacterium]|nr:hypothetical protein [Gammaproteobacteria bacterium]
MGHLSNGLAASHWLRSSLVLAALAAAPAWVQAQAIPQGTSPGLFAPDLLRDQLREQQRQQAIEERARRIEVPPLQGDDADAEDGLPDDSPAFVLQGISFNSSVFLTDDELQALAEPFVGVTITFADLNRLLRAINARYAALGQLTARAVIPPQSLDDGQLRVALVEAKVDRVDVQGQPRVRAHFYREQIGVVPDDILDSPLMIENIRRFNATTPGPQISAGLAPGERFGTTRIELETFEPDPWAWSVFANNYGSESTGREQIGGTLNWFAPTGVADNLAAVVVATSGSQYFNLRYSRPVTRRHGVAWIEAGRNDLEIKKGPLRDLGIEGESTTVALGIDQPWWQSARWLWLFGGSYSWQNSESTIENFDLSDIDTQEVTLRAQFEFRDQPWYIRYEQRLRQARTDNKVTGDSGSFTLLNGDLYAAREVSERVEMVGKLGWQYTTKPEELSSSLLKQFGGPTNIRGYDPGIIASPQGINLSLEGHWRLNERWRPYAFLDYGRAMELGLGDEDLSSVGVGVNARFGKRVSANLTVASALDTVVPDQDSSQLLLQIVIR